MRKLLLLGVLVTAVAAAGCSGAPTAPQSALMPGAVLGQAGGSVSTPSAGMAKTPITGTLDFVSAEAPGRVLITPSGLCHYWDYPVHDYFYGDVEGPVIFYEQGHGPCEPSHMTFSGPFEGDVVWRGRRGHISGQFETNCKADPVTFVSCDGTMNARGSDGLEGVQFHFKWGPGNYPFAYAGTAFAQ